MPLLCSGVIVLRVSRNEVGHEVVDSIGDAIWRHGCMAAGAVTGRMQQDGSRRARWLVAVSVLQSEVQVENCDRPAALRKC